MGDRDTTQDLIAQNRPFTDDLPISYTVYPDGQGTLPRPILACCKASKSRVKIVLGRQET